MRKKILIFGACCLLAVGSLSGCGDKADDTKNAKTESTEKTDKKQTDKKADAKKEELKTIGTKAEGESVISVTLKNSTGKDITGIALKAGNLPEYGAGLMTDGDVFKNGESRILYYDTAADTAAGGDAASYEVQVYFADQSHLALHTVNFGSFKESELCLEEEVVFLKYEDTTTKKVVSTKDAEISVKEAQAAAQAQAEAEAQAAAEAQAQAAAEAAAQAQAEAEAQAAAEAAAAAQAQAEAEAWAQQQQWTDPAPAPAPEPAPAPQPGGGGGCLNDGLVQ